MDSIDRKKISVITKYAVNVFTESDWYTLGQITGQLKEVIGHGRLLRSLSFNDDDYEYCAAEVLDTIFENDSHLIDDIIDHFDIDLWYQQKFPEKYQRIFGTTIRTQANFWKNGYLRMFVSHLSTNKERMSNLKSYLANWGISAFIAHEDIEASKEWRDEVEAGLETMDVMVAVVEPKFKESDWCVQEVGYALGRHIDIVPLRAGIDPFGFFGKYQGIQIKGKIPQKVAAEIAELLLKKPKHRKTLLNGISKAFSGMQSDHKIDYVKQLDSWSILSNLQIKELLEEISLSSYEQGKLKNLIGHVGAFTPEFEERPEQQQFDDDIPF